MKMRKEIRAAVLFIVLCLAPGLLVRGCATAVEAQTSFLRLKRYTETLTTASISAGAVTYDLAQGTHFSTVLNANITSVTISNAPTRGVVTFTVVFTADGTQRTITWPGSVVWSGGTAPTMTATNNKVDLVTFVTYNNGTVWLAILVGQNF